MKKALVIKGADFSMNKLTTIGFAEEVPCTGITLSQSTVTITEYNPVTVTATKTPSNTTDVLLWATSDASVATVSGGVITPVGIGVCTITASCGTQQATVLVNVAFVYVENYAFAMLGYNSGNGIVSYTYPKYDFILVYGNGNQKTDKAIPGANMAISNGVYGIKLPNNTTKVQLTITDTSGVKSSQWSGGLQWLKDEALDATHPNMIKRISGQFFNLKTETNLTFSVPDGADSFVFNIQLASEASSETDPATIVSGLGFGVAFLAE